MRLPRHVALLLVTFVAAVAGGTAAWWGFPPSAFATVNCGPDCRCGTSSGPSQYYTQATNSIGASYQSYGVKSGADVGDNKGNEVFDLTNIECVHVSSIWETVKNGDFVEVGWSRDQVGIPAGQQCSNSNPGPPPTVMYAFQSFGSYECHEYHGLTLSPGTHYPASLQRLDTNGNWQIIFNGVDLANEQVDFIQGAGVTDGERHFVSDADPTVESAKSDFTDMQYYQLSSGSWQPWTSHQCWGGAFTSYNAAYHDPAFFNQFPNGDHEVSVVALGTSGC